MDTLTPKPSFVTIYSDQLSHSFQATTNEESKHYFPLVHMADIYNQTRPNDFNKIVAESMELAYENIIITNNSPLRVHVRNRSGFIKTFIPTSNQHENSITIFTISAMRNPYTKSVEFSDGVENYCQALLDRYSKIVDSNLDEIKLAYSKIIEYGKKIKDGELDSNKYLTQRTNPIVAVKNILYVVTKVTVPMLAFENKKSVYLTNKDLVLSTKNLMDVDDHPSVTSGNPLSHVQDAAENSLFSLILVDNKNHYSTRYAYMFGEIVEVRAVKDATRQDGLYVFFKSDGKAEQSYVTPENLEKSKHLFKSREEALTGGDIAASYSKTLDEVNHRNKVEESRLKLRETEMAGQLSEMKLLLEQKKIELDNVVANNKLKDSHTSSAFTERKYVSQDYFEERSRKRNETMEMVKTGATITAAIAGVFLVISKAVGK